MELPVGECMKEFDVKLYELTLEEVLKVVSGKDILVYNKLFEKSRIYEGGRSIKNMWNQISPVLHSELKFFVFREEDIPRMDTNR